MQTGFAVIHGNQLEDLRDLVVQWLQQHPVSPLAQEAILVQSNGIAQWLKMALADTDSGAPGIAAGLQVELPNQFVWRLYRAVLGERIPASLPYDKDNLTWRLLRLLPALTTPDFAPLQRYLEADPDGRKAFQLAGRLADLFDQYQVYRADWLQAWSEHRDVLTTPSGERPVPAEQRWQPALWRQLRDDLSRHAAPAQFSSRADVHQQALAVLSRGDIQQPAALPPRVVVFGISSLPRQTVELLSALGQHRQVLLAVVNPCRYFWGDIATMKDEMRQQRWRQQRKQGQPVMPDPAALHLMAPPLLASLGKQGRDYISMLSEFDEPEQYQEWFSGRIDLFRDRAGTAPTPVLAGLQQDLLDLNGRPEQPRPLSPTDTSVTFHQAHSRQREVEILQDQLISDLAADPTLEPRDMIVMMPDIGTYAPHIHAVFGRLEDTDERYIPYSLADQQHRGHNPVLIALEYLLALPEQRVTLNEVFDLLEVPAIQRRLGLNPEALPELRLWLREAGARWGLDHHHRERLGLAAVGEPFSWWYGLERVLLGYLTGQQEAYAGREPYAEAAGLGAASLGPVLLLVQRLQDWEEKLSTWPTRSLSAWQALLAAEDGLLADFFDLSTATDNRTFTQLSEALERLHTAALDGQFDGELHLAVLREAWLAEVDSGGLSQRFMAGSVTFSTLLPMRAIPFRQVYMLGLNDGDYPRSRRPDDFDLMQLDYRPGDRSRRDDDRYLFLEALLSARDSLYISWVGRNVRDNEPLPPSVLVSQLRDVLDQYWTTGGAMPVSEHLTTTYPLQPFARSYFSGQHQTYAWEWEQAPAGHAKDAQVASAGAERQDLPPATPETTPELTLASLLHFLQNPPGFYLEQRFQTRYWPEEEVLPDHEPFALNGLEQFQLGRQLLTARLADPALNVSEELDRMAARGLLPVALFGVRARQTLMHQVETVWRRLASRQQQWQPVATPVSVQLNLAGHALAVELTEVYQSATGAQALVELRPTAILHKGALTWAKVWRPVLRQLLLNAAAHPVSSWVYGLDECVRVPAVPAEQAQQALDALVQAWEQALSQPLPVLPKTAFSWLERGAGDARNAYAGTFQLTGELAENPAAQRYFPDFDALQEAGLETWANAVYGVFTALEVELSPAGEARHD